MTWEECKPVEKKVPMAVAHMDCVPVPVLILIVILILIVFLIFILIVTTIMIMIMIMVILKVRYVDYENKTTEAMADNIDCFVHKKPVNHDDDVDHDLDDDPNHASGDSAYVEHLKVCEPVTSKKCAETTYTRCEEVGFTINIIIIIIIRLPQSFYNYHVV